MRTKLFLGVILAGLLGLGYAFTVQPGAADASPHKNLQVLPKNTSKKDIKAIMKSMSKALGVDCDYCHNMDDMASDEIDHKKVARAMMRMTNEINGKHLKSAKNKVSCMTCHRGEKAPK